MGSDCNKVIEMVGRFLNSWAVTLIVAAMMMFVTFGADALGRLEGRYFPAVSNVMIDVTDGPTENSSILGGSFDRPRGKCGFERIEWYLAKPGGAAARLDFEFLDPSQVRDAGPNDFGPWLLHATDLQIANFVYADVYHKCHAGWLTVTRFYPQ